MDILLRNFFIEMGALKASDAIDQTPWILANKSTPELLEYLSWYPAWGDASGLTVRIPARLKTLLPSRPG